MEYKTRFHTHVIVGYSMHKIQATALFFAFAARLSHFATRLLHLPRSFNIYRAAFAFAARLFKRVVGDPSQPP